MIKKSKANILFDKQFGSYVVKKRTQKNWTQAELADRIGTDYQNISRLELGKTSPTLFWCCKLADAFEMKVSTFLKDFDYSFKG